MPTYSLADSLLAALRVSDFEFRIWNFFWGGCVSASVRRFSAMPKRARTCDRQDSSHLEMQ